MKREETVKGDEGNTFFFSFLLSELTTCQDCQRNSMILFHVYQKYKNWGSEASGLFKWNVGSHQTNSHDSVWVFVLVSKSDLPRHQEPSEKREYLMLKSSFLSIKQCKWLHFQCLWQINRLQTCFDYFLKNVYLKVIKTFILITQIWNRPMSMQLTCSWKWLMMFFKC